MPVIVPEIERLVFDGMAFARMHSSILLFVFQRRAEEDFVRGEVVPNGEDVTVVLPAAGAAVPVFLPASDDVAMSKMPRLPDWFADVLPELDLARDGVSREVPCSALKGETVPDSLPATPKCSDFGALKNKV